MANKKEKTILESSIEEIQTIKEALQENMSNLLKGSSIGNELMQIVNEAIEDEEDFDDIENDEVEDEEIENSEIENTEVEDIPGETPEEIPGEEIPSAEDEEEIIDLTGASDEEVLKVFKLMSPDDEIEVVKSGSDIHIKDKATGGEYIVKDEPAESAIEVSEMETEPIDVPDPIGGEEEIEEGQLANGTTNISEGSHTEELARVKELGNKSGDPDYSRGTKSTPVDVNPTQNKVGKQIDSNVKGNGEKGKPNYETGAKEPKETLDPEQEKGGDRIDDNVLGHGEGGKTPNYPAGKAKESKNPEQNDSAKVQDAGITNTDYQSGAKKPNEIKDPVAKEVNYINEHTGEIVSESNIFNKLNSTYKVLTKVRDDNKTLKESLSLKENEIKNLNEVIKNFKSEQELYKNAISEYKENLNEVALFSSNLNYAIKLMLEHATTKAEKKTIIEKLNKAKTLNESKEIYNGLISELDDKIVNKENIVERTVNNVKTSGASKLNESTVYKDPGFARIKEIMDKIK